MLLYYSMKTSTILNNVKQSCISISHYIEIIKKPFIDSFLSLSLVLFVIGVISGIHLSVTQIPKVSSNIDLVVTDIVTHYPDDLVFNFNNGNLEFNRESITVPFSSKIGQDYQKAFPFENFAYLTKEELSLDKTKNFSGKYFLLITQNKLLIADPANPTLWQEYPLNQIFTDVEDVQVSKDTVKFVSLKFENWKTNNFTKIQILTTIVTTLSYILAKIWFLLIETLLVILLFKLYSVNISVNQTIKLTMNILIPVSIITFITNITYQNINLPMQTIAFWVIIIYFMSNLKKVEIKSI